MNTPTNRDMDCPESECVYYGKPKHKDCGCLTVPGPSAAPSATMIARVAKAICCPDGKCHTEWVKASERGKYLTDLPCYSLSPDVVASARAAIQAMRTPTAAMLKAARRHTAETSAEERMATELADFGTRHDIKMRGRFGAMIDAALSDDGAKPDTERSGTPTLPPALVQS